MKSIFRFLRQYSAFFLFLILEGIALLFVFSYNAYQYSYVFNSANRISGELYRVFGNLYDYVDLNSTNKVLMQENSELRTKVAQLENEVLSLKEDSLQVDILQFNPETANTFIAARVVNSSVSSYQNFITINKGTLSGVNIDMGVITSKGVVGVVTSSSKYYSVVMPIINHKLKVSSKIKKNNYVGALAWDGKNHRFDELQEIPTYVDVQQGDSIITSGYSAMFPEGILVGVVEDVESDDHNPFYAIKVRLAVDFQSVSHVYVVSNPFKNEQSKLERSVY